MLFRSATLKEFSTNAIAGILIGVGVLVVIVSGVNYYFTQKSEAYATAKGAESGIGMVTGAIYNNNHNDGIISI